MLSYKVFGALCIVGALGELGRRASQSLDNRVQELNDFLFALQTLESEVLFAVSPLHEAAARISAEAKTRVVAKFFGDFSIGLAHEHEPARLLWPRLVSQVLGLSSLSRTDQEIIERLGNHIGLSDRQDQLKHITRVRSALEAALTSAKEELCHHQGLYRKLGLTLGLIVVLLSW